MALVSYSTNKEKLNEEWIYELLNLYGKMISFKLSFNKSNEKEKIIVDFQNLTNENIDKIRSIEYDIVEKIKYKKNEEMYVLSSFSMENAKGLTDSVEIDKKYNMYFNNCTLKNKKGFIEKFNKEKTNIRNLLDKECTQKYLPDFTLMKNIDDKISEIQSNSKKKIKYN